MLTKNKSFVLKYGSITSAIVNSPFKLGNTGLLHKAKKTAYFRFLAIKKLFFSKSLFLAKPFHHYFRKFVPTFFEIFTFFKNLSIHFSKFSRFWKICQHIFRTFQFFSKIVYTFFEISFFFKKKYCQHCFCNLYFLKNFRNIFQSIYFLWKTCQCIFPCFLFKKKCQHIFNFFNFS